MRKLLFFTGLLVSSNLCAQKVKYEGTHPPDKAVLRLLDQYNETFQGNETVAQRDARRKALVSPAYFYHGMDGAPIGLEGLTKRQTKNEFKVFADSVYDHILYQYENSAVYLFKEWQHLTDKGIEKENTNSVLILLSKENGEWKILADIIGQKPKGVPQPGKSVKK